jgi:hypothetical protein
MNPHCDMTNTLEQNVAIPSEVEGSSEQKEYGGVRGDWGGVCVYWEVFLL